MKIFVETFEYFGSFSVIFLIVFTESFNFLLQTFISNDIVIQQPFFLLLKLLHIIGRIGVYVFNIPFFQFIKIEWELKEYILRISLLSNFSLTYNRQDIMKQKNRAALRLATFFYFILLIYIFASINQLLNFIMQIILKLRNGRTVLIPLHPKLINLLLHFNRFSCNSS